MVNTPSASSKSTKRASEAKKKSTAGPVLIAPAPGSVSSSSSDPKVKTATRSKSGCMTCRIRRKKCDLERIDGSCQTCVRLRIECLGWGSKRPEALRDANIVKQLQNMIKIFLASNNMIKGSARSSAQFINQGPPVAATQPPNASILQTTYSSNPDFNSQGNNPYSPSNGANGAQCGPLLLPTPGTTPLHGRGVGESTGPHQAPSYVGANFLRFDFLRQHNGTGSLSSDLNGTNSQPGSASTLQLNGLANSLNGSTVRSGQKAGSKSKGSQSAGRRGKRNEEAMDEDDDEDFDDEGDELEQEEEDTKPPIRNMPPPPPNYPHFDGRHNMPYYPPHPYGGPNPYTVPPPLHYQPEAYNQSDMRSSSTDRGAALHEQVSALDRERRKKMEELHRKGIPSYGRETHGGPPYPVHHSYDPHQFVWGAGVGVAGPGRNYMPHMPNPHYPPPPPLQHGYPPHVGYGDPGHVSSYSPSYVRGDQPQPYNGPPRLGGAAHRTLLSNPLSMVRANGNGPVSPTNLPRGPHPSGNDYMSGSEMKSPTTPLSAASSYHAHRRSMDMNGSAYPVPVEADADMEGDVDGEPMTQTQLMQEMSMKTGGVPALGSLAQIPARSTHTSFGNSYSFDKNCNDPDINTQDDTDNTALIPVGQVGAGLGAFTVDGSLAQALNTSAFYASFFQTGNSLQSIGLGNLNQTDLLNDPAAILTANVGNIDFSLLQSFQQGVFAPAPQPSPPITAPGFTTKQMELLEHYRRHISKLQYLIANNFDPSLADELFEFALNNRTAMIGTLTLTALFKTRMKGLQLQDGSSDAGDVLLLKQQMMDALGVKLGAGASTTLQAVDEGDAMGSLHMLSAVLFEGGTDSEWDHYLDIARTWVSNHPIVKTGRWLVTGENPNGQATTGQDQASGALVPVGEGGYQLDKKRAFVIKASFWFDILGAITMRRAPHFLETYRELFGRNGGCAMEKVMGCDEKVLLAIAETAALAKWKWDMEQDGCLSLPELVSKGQEIEKKLAFIGPVYYGNTYLNNSAGANNLRNPPPFVDESNPSAQLLGELFNKTNVNNLSAGTVDGVPSDAKDAHTTRLISNVFRATAKLYVRTVQSGCRPGVPEIKSAVDETVEAFKNLAASTLDRSLVFPIALAGCMTDDRDKRDYLAGRLKKLGREGEAVGNSKSCLQLMEKVWEKRDKGPFRDVDWIDTMKEMGWSLLLV